MLGRLFINAHIHGNIIHVVGSADLHLLIDLVLFYRREVSVKDSSVIAPLIVDGIKLLVFLVLRIVPMVEGSVCHQALDRSCFFDLFRIHTLIFTHFASINPLSVHMFGNFHIS